MSMHAKRSKGLWLVVLAFVVCSPAIAGSGGGSRYLQYYLTSVERNQPKPKVNAWSRLDVASFKVNTVDKRYRLLPIVLVNDSDQPLTLSATQDKVTIAMPSGAAFTASLQISKLDRALWDTWDNDTKNMIEYPESVESFKSKVIYVLVPRNKLDGVPFRIDFTIASLGITMKLLQPPAMAD